MDINKQNNHSREPKIGVIIGGGSVKSFGAIYLFECLEQLKIPISVVGGCSGGAFVAASRAMGMNMLHRTSTYLDRMSQYIKFDLKNSLILFRRNFSENSLKSSILKKDVLLNLLKELYGDIQYKDLEIPLLIQTTNVATGESCVITEGLVYEAVYASSAIPPFFPPIEINGSYFMDGVLSRTEPVADMIKNDIDIIINVQFDDTHDDESSLFSCIVNFVGKCYHRYANLQRALAIDTHHFEMIIIPIRFNETLSVLHSHRFPIVYETCRREIDKHIPEILLAIEHFKQVARH